MNWNCELYHHTHHDNRLYKVSCNLEIVTVLKINVTGNNLYIWIDIDEYV